jgi:hypothetical protein
MIRKIKREDARCGNEKIKLTLSLIWAIKIIYFSIKIFYLIKKVQLVCFFILKLSLKQSIYLILSSNKKL